MVGDLVRTVSALALVLAFDLPAVEAAERVLRYSGKVERVDLDEGVMVVDEMAARGHRRRHALHVGPETPIVTAERLRPWEMRGNAAFEEIAVSLLDVITGDFVVVESTEEGGRLVALRITIVDNRRRP
jgi:hypothetical protein